MEPKIAINISTYQRPDGRIPELLSKTLLSIKNQIYQDWKVFLIGDRYEDNSEFFEISEIIPSEKLFIKNLDVAVERQRYPNGGHPLWCSGGTNATNFAISEALSQGYDWICHLDHDDIWLEDHLLEISKKIKELGEDFIIISTLANYLNKFNLPDKSQIGPNFVPINGQLVHSSVCINWSKTELRYRDVLHEEGRIYVADGDMWNRLSEYMRLNGKRGYLIDKVTTLHLEETGMQYFSDKI